MTEFVWFFGELFIVFQRVVLLNKHRYMHLALHQEPSEPKQRNTTTINEVKREEEFFRDFFEKLVIPKQFLCTTHTNSR